MLRTQVSKETVHYYIREGLLPRPPKRGRNIADYNDSYIERIRLIKELQDNYFLPLSVIKKIMKNRGNRQKDNRFSVCGPNISGLSINSFPAKSEVKTPPRRQPDWGRNGSPRWRSGGSSPRPFGTVRRSIPTPIQSPFVRIPFSSSPETVFVSGHDLLLSTRFRDQARKRLKMIRVFSQVAGSEKESQPKEASPLCETCEIVAESFFFCMRNFPAARGGTNPAYRSHAECAIKGRQQQGERG